MTVSWVDALVTTLEYLAYFIIICVVVGFIRFLLYLPHLAVKFHHDIWFYAELVTPIVVGIFFVIFALIKNEVTTGYCFEFVLAIALFCWWVWGDALKERKQAYAAGLAVPLNKPVAILSQSGKTICEGSRVKPNGRHYVWIQTGDGQNVGISLDEWNKFIIKLI